MVTPFGFDKVVEEPIYVMAEDYVMRNKIDYRGLIEAGLAVDGSQLSEEGSKL
jgi:hypothetical protein